ncbi:MAG: NlpC/P60 family protein [Ancrocorticia sp.]
MRVRPRMLVAACAASLAVGALSGISAPEAQAAGVALAPQSTGTFASSIQPASTGFRWNEAKANQLLEVARRYEGFPYISGANGPFAFDCSSYTRHVYSQFGIYLPRLPDDQLKMGPRVPASQAKPGDLMWWPGHIGIYTGNNRHIAARNSELGIMEGGNYGNPIYIRILR